MYLVNKDYYYFKSSIRIDRNGRDWEQRESFSHISRPIAFDSQSGGFLRHSDDRRRGPFQTMGRSQMTLISIPQKKLSRMSADE